MRKVFVCGFLLLVLSACCMSPHAQFVNAVDKAFLVIGPEYEEYIKRDENLSDETKGTRIRTMIMLRETIEEAKNQ